MTQLQQRLGTDSQAGALRDAFLRWQCRMRQIAMREHAGRPDDAITPGLTLGGEAAPVGRVITVLNRAPGHSVSAELAHMVRKTNDPAQRREAAQAYFAAAYYQNAKAFCDTLTATFPPGSPGAARIRAAGVCRLSFEAYAQRFDLAAQVRPLERRHPLFEATWWHNQLFNPTLHPETEVLAFAPDWTASTADPTPTRPHAGR